MSIRSRVGPARSGETWSTQSGPKSRVLFESATRRTSASTNAERSVAPGGELRGLEACARPTWGTLLIASVSLRLALSQAASGCFMVEPRQAGCSCCSRASRGGEASSASCMGVDRYYQTARAVPMLVFVG